MRVNQRWLCGGLAALLGGAMPSAGAADQYGKISGVELRRCGIYANELAEPGKDSKPASDARGVVGSSRLVRETREIPAGVGTAFGCEVMLRGTPRGAMASFVAVLRLPAGAPRQSFRGPQSFPIGEGGGYVGYTFRSEQDLVAGAWMLEIRVNEKKLAEAAFTVTK